MIFIESKDNKIFKEVKKLKDRKGRNKSGKYLIEGYRLVQEAFKAGAEIETLFIENQDEKFDKYIGQYINDDIKVFGLSKSLFLELCFTEQPQGIVAVVKMREHEINYDGSFYLLCDKVQDPGNIGTIIRTAHAAAVDGIIMSKGTVDIYNDKSIRSTMGSIFYVPIIYDDENYTIVKSLKEEGFSLLATSLEGKKNFFEEDLKGKILITVGNEGNGVSDEVYSLCDKKVKIPMPGNSESLNVGVAASIVMYEKVRQNS